MGAYVDNIKTSDGVTHPIQDATVFTGTLSQWNQLTTDQKKAYRFANFTDDYEGGGSGSGGHTIEDPDGTDMTQRTNLQFLDAGVTDDSTNNRTKIENVQVVSDVDDLENASDGMYMVSEDDDPTVLDASMIAFGDGSVEDIIGDTDISHLADGTLTGAINALSNLVVGTFSYDAATGNLYYEVSESGYTFSMANGYLYVDVASTT